MSPRACLWDELEQRPDLLYGDDLTRALASVEKSLGILKNLADDYPKFPDYKKDLALNYVALAVTYGKAERQTEMPKAYEQSVALLQELVAAYPQVPLYEQMLQQFQTALRELKPSRRD